MFKYDVAIGKTATDAGTIVNVNALEITFYKSEELDFGVFTIPATTRFENFQILDRVDIKVTDGSNTETYDPFLIISDEVAPVSKSNLFKHTITFIEDIHKFEKVLAGSVFFTQPLFGPKKTLLNALQHIRNVAPFERASLHATTRLFDIDLELSTFLSTIDAPQFFFSGINLREMINSIASYVNAIGRMKNNRKLVFSFYNEILNVFDINENAINKTLRNQTKYFTSSVESSIENATGADTAERALIVHPNSTGFTSMRSTNLKLTDETFEFRVPYPIERLQKVEYKTRVRVSHYYEVNNLAALSTIDNNQDFTSVAGRTKITTLFKILSNNTFFAFNNTGQTALRNGVFYLDQTFFEVFPIGLQLIDNPQTPQQIPTWYEVFDATPHFIEYNKYKQLNIDTNTLLSRRKVDLQSNNYHFEINGTTLSNNRLFGVFDGANSIENFYLRVLWANGYESPGLIPTFNATENFVKNNWDEQEYRFTYVPYFGTRVRLNKDDVTDHPYNTQFSANQGERIVSAERLVRNMYGMAQRLGQDEIEFKRYYTDLSEQFELGQITEDGFVIASKHITFFLNYYLVNYQLSKNFNRFANRIALDQENRPFDIGRGSKTTNRNLLYNEYIELDTEIKPNTSLIRTPGVNVFMNTIRPNVLSQFNLPIRYGIFAGSELADATAGQGIVLQPITFSEGNSLNFYWSFSDVINAGAQLELGKYNRAPKFLGFNVPFLEVDIFYNKDIRYTDNNEELNNFELSFGHNLPDVVPNNLPIVSIPTDNNALIGGHSFRTVFDDSFVVKKDKSESLSMNYVVSVLPNFKYNNRIIIGRELTFSNNLIIANKNANLVVYTSIKDTTKGIVSGFNEKYNSIENLYTKGTATSYTITTSVEESSGKVVVNIPSNVLNTLSSWAIGDTNGNLYLGANVDTDVKNTVYFNFTNKRENISYTLDGITAFKVLAPTNLGLTAGETTIAATWDNFQTNVTFELGIREIAPSVTSFVTQPPITNKFFTFSNLVAGRTYQIRVRSIRDTLSSTYVTQDVTTSSAPSKIDVFALSRIFSNVANLRADWNAVNNVTGYNAQARLASKSWESEFVENKSLGSTHLSTIFEVGINNILVGRVRGQNDVGFGPFSDEDVQVIPIVTSRAATVISDTVIRASWDPLSNLIEPTINQEIGFEIKRTPISPSGAPVIERVLHTATSYDFTGLSPETQHEIEIKAYYKYINVDYGKTLYSNSFTTLVTTQSVPLPAEVLAPIVTNASGYPTQSEVQWNIFNPNNFAVTRAFSTAITSPYAATNFSVVIPASTTVQFGASGFNNNVDVTLSARFRVGTSPNFVFSTQTNNVQRTLPPPPPPTPTGLQINNVTSTSAVANWNFVSEATQGYQVEINPGSQNYFTSFSNQAVSLDITNLTPDTSYTAKVRSRSVNLSGPSAYSSTVGFKTLVGPTAPAAPTNLQVTSFVVDGDEVTVNLSWTDNATNELGYRVYSRLGSSGSFTNVSGNLPPNTTTYQDIAPDGGNVFYYVAAYNSVGESVSNTIQF